MPNNINVESIQEELTSFSNDDLFNITSWGADLTFRELTEMYKDGDLLKPELQRKYVWTKNEASRFVDSILLGLPVPSIFLANRSDEKKLIIDGYQRIMTIHDYITGKFSNDHSLFSLSNSEIINAKWRGKSFIQLTPEEQRKIKTTTIHAIIFSQNHPKNDSGMYQIFERINTGGTSLKPQEIRNCIYQGSLNSKLIELNKNLDWRLILGLKMEDSRMYDIELILRFFAIKNLYSSRNINVNQINLIKYLNDYMSIHQSDDLGKIATFENEFVSMISFVRMNIGPLAFRNYNKDKNKFSRKINPAVYDAITIAISTKLNEGITIENIDFTRRYIDLLENERFNQLVSKRTTNVDNILSRIDLAILYLFGEINEQ